MAEHYEQEQARLTTLHEAAAKKRRAEIRAEDERRKELDRQREIDKRAHMKALREKQRAREAAWAARMESEDGERTTGMAVEIREFQKRMDSARRADSARRRDAQRRERREAREKEAEYREHLQRIADEQAEKAAQRLKEIRAAQKKAARDAAKKQAERVERLKLEEEAARSKDEEMKTRIAARKGMLVA